MRLPESIIERRRSHDEPRAAQVHGHEVVEVVHRTGSLAGELDRGRPADTRPAAEHGILFLLDRLTNPTRCRSAGGIWFFRPRQLRAAVILFVGTKERESEMATI